MLWWNIYMVKFQCFPGMKQWSIDTIVTLCYIEIHAVQNNQLQDDYQSIPNIPGYQFLSKSLVLKNSCCQFVLLKSLSHGMFGSPYKIKGLWLCSSPVSKNCASWNGDLIAYSLHQYCCYKIKNYFFFYQEIERWTTIVNIHIFIFIFLLKKIF